MRHRVGVVVSSVMLAVQLSARAAATQPAATQPDSHPVWQLLSDGRQREAELLLDERIRRDPTNGDDLFFDAVLTRSRFDVEGAARRFRDVIALDPKSDRATAAQAMIDIDRAVIFTAAEFKTLHALADAHPEDGRYPWLIAIACRTKNKNEEGVRAFEALGKHFTVGPVLFHQTYGNLLDELGRHEQALPHRHLAIKLEPAYWSLEALANTYKMMGKHDLAVKAYRDALKVSPNNGRGWSRMYGSAMKAADGPTAVEAALKLRQLYPKTDEGLMFLASAYVLDQKFSEAADAYLAALKKKPDDTELAKLTIDILQRAGRIDEARRLQHSTPPK